MTQKILYELGRPFELKKLHWRTGATNLKQDGSLKWGNSPMAIAYVYIDARDVMQRLDHIVGAGNWQTRYSHCTDRIAICELGIRFEGEWIWKSDGAGDTDVEGDKGRISDALKRTAVQWGIGRYLYKAPKDWTPIDDKKRLVMSGGIPTGIKLPDWFYPEKYEDFVKPPVAV